MNVLLSTRLREWCLSPTDFWDNKTTKLLVQNEWAVLQRRNKWNADNYSTAGYILDDPQFVSSKLPISAWAGERQIYLESSSSKKCEVFFDENGLCPIDIEELLLNDTAAKLDDAMVLLNSIPNLAGCVTQLVRTIVVLKSAHPDEDVSYSHPSLPFSIFVSICDEGSAVASARVAESILHESMHLRLSLIQKFVGLISFEARKGETYFAPWRNEKRPVDGVLHGIFVFRAILEFFREMVKIDNQGSMGEYFGCRIEEISCQLRQVREFHKSPGLNTIGSKLAQRLLAI